MTAEALEISRLVPVAEEAIAETVLTRENVIREVAGATCLVRQWESEFDKGWLITSWVVRVGIHVPASGGSRAPVEQAAREAAEAWNRCIESAVAVQAIVREALGE